MRSGVARHEPDPVWDPGAFEVRVSSTKAMGPDPINAYLFMIFSNFKN